MKSVPPTTKPLPAPGKKSGFAHLVASTGYSFHGFRRALKEPAFRQELVLAGVLLLVLGATGARLEAYLVQAIALLLLFATEALNTAIEVLTDAISPAYSRFAKHAKDLGSFAVFCLLTVNLLLTAFFALAL